MDALIELIAWIFRTLFGSQEPQAPMGPRGRSNAEPQRGPYDYGDGRSSGPRPRTLAELLEEARRETQPGGSTTPAPRPAQRSEVRPVPAQPAPQPVRPAPQPVSPAPRPPQPATVRTVQAVKPPHRPANAPTPPAPRAQPPAQPKRRRAKQRPAQALPAQAPQPMPNLGLIAPPRKRSSRGGMDLAPWLSALRDANPDKKAALAAQAIVHMEIFGPPRARRAHRPGQRWL
ncbi:MAG: hypothetical protein M5U26_00835 [Planctomycetota bacterium]|nr:hypothetical protein [Planctomycetota bacterium]